MVIRKGFITSIIIASECQNDMCKVTADALFWEIRRLLLRAKPLRKVWTNSLLPLWMDFKGQQTWQFSRAWILQFVTEKVVSHVQDTFFKVHHFDNYDCAKSQIFAKHTLHFFQCTFVFKPFFLQSMYNCLIQSRSILTFFVLDLTLKWNWYGC